jgi:hypothetical protein
VSIGQTITLEPLRHSDIKENQDKTSAKGHNLMSESESRRSETLDIPEEVLKVQDNLMSRMSKNFSNGYQTLKSGDLQGKPANVSMSESDAEEEVEEFTVTDEGEGGTELGSYNYS